MKPRERHSFGVRIASQRQNLGTLVCSPASYEGSPSITLDDARFWHSWHPRDGGSVFALSDAGRLIMKAIFSVPQDLFPLLSVSFAPF